MVLEIRLVLQLIGEMQEVLGMDVLNAENCIKTLRRLGLCAAIARTWVVDPKTDLMWLDAILSHMSETIPGWRSRIQDLIEMI
jgi:hypothetical protein